MSPIYLIVGTPGSGKTWVMRQLESKFNVIHHDGEDGVLKGGFTQWGGEDGYVKEIARQARISEKPVLAETPFSVSKILEPLEKLKFKVHPLFIIESDSVTRERYKSREGRDIPPGHLTRIGTYRVRAKELGAKSGTSLEILNYLRSI